MDSDPSRQPPPQQQLVMGRKASSTSAIDKLNKKKKKKKRSKKDKRSSTTTNSAPAVSGRARARKTRAVTSCPPHLDSLFPSINSNRRNDDDLDEVCDLFNENLRWLPLIANYSKNHPINSASSANSAVQAKLTESTRTLKEDSEDEGERMDVYKTNRRKRYLAAQQRILDLYPDQKATNDYIVAAGDCSEKSNASGAGVLARPPQAPVHLPVSAKPSLTSVASSDAIPSSSSSKSFEKIDFAVPSALNATPGLTSSIAQKVL